MTELDRQRTATMPHRRAILFVDDDPNVVQGLQRLLRPYRDQWSMAFATSPDEALDRVRTGRFDVVVTDMRMPKMSGAELLGEVQRIAPHTVRIILSGTSEVSAIVKAVGPSHQFLAKPCDPAVLEASIRRACALRSYMGDPRILELVGGTATIPSLPSLYREVIAAIRAERPLSEIGALVARDMGMTTRLLQLVNSSYFGLARRTDDPARAVMILGIETLQSLVLGNKIFESFPTKETAIAEGIWRDGVAAVGCARRICAHEDADAVITNQTLVAALLHDVGLLALLARAPELFHQIWPAEPSDGREREQAERTGIGASHSQIGAGLLSMWGLPDPIVEAVALHHDPAPEVHGAIAPLTIVHVAQAFARDLPDTADPEALRKSGLDLEYLARVGVAPARVDAWRLACGGGIANS
jgi:HD-like signal output (HDOD) protein